MEELKCPNCGKLFQIDESGYEQIVKQIRDSEFHKELDRREKEIKLQKESELKLIKMEQEKSQSEEISKRDALLSKKDMQIAQLTARIDSSESDRKLAVNEAVGDVKKQLYEKDAEIAELQRQLKTKDYERQLSESSIKSKYEAELKMKEEQLETYKDFKLRQSTKMIGESLEQHCLNQFNAIRMTAFPRAYFDKDNDASSGSKGDFIFREASDDGTEFISIMFEMKNEADETKTKHKNDDFLKELDKDRNEKKCEYAVLVSMLEPESELYNSGIVDVSYEYPKMYVIRPQLFIPMISLLRNAAMNSLKYQQELREVRNQQIDILNFEENMNVFKSGFARNYELASRRFNEAIAEIDKSIAQLQKVKDALTSSERNLRLANDKAQDLSIKKLTKNSPTLRAMFDELSEQGEEEI